MLQTAVACLLSFWMDLSREAHQLIVHHVGNKSDLCSLARVSKSFQRAAERALYNTIYLRDPATTITICSTLAIRDRLALLVDAVSIFASGADGEDDDDDDDDDDGEDADEGLPENYWRILAAALRRTNRLRFLNIYANGDAAHSWILRDCNFQLRTFHCDLHWDADLIVFLGTQRHLHDLYLADYSNTPSETTVDWEARAYKHTSATPSLDSTSLPSLSTFECSFTEAVSLLAPGRPLRRIKTCFSREDTQGKTAELGQLLRDLRRSTRRISCLDLADSSYTEDFSLTVLGEVSTQLPGLRYLGTLVLPVGLEVCF